MSADKIQEGRTEHATQPDNFAEQGAINSPAANNDFRDASKRKTDTSSDHLPGMTLDDKEQKDRREPVVSVDEKTGAKTTTFDDGVQVVERPGEPTVVRTPDGKNPDGSIRYDETKLYEDGTTAYRSRDGGTHYIVPGKGSEFVHPDGSVSQYPKNAGRSRHYGPGLITKEERWHKE